MDNESTNKADVLPSPRPVAPREAEIVDARSVTFRWEPVDEATAYRIEVASDTAFESVVFDQEVADDQTRLTATDVFPADEQTFFWRVLAQNESGWSRGERIESFVSGTPEGAEQHLQVPTEEEAFGPVGGLMQAASESVAEELSATEEARERRLEKERERGVAYEGVPSSQILAIAASILLAIAVIIVLLFQWTSFMMTSAREVATDPEDYVQLRQAELEAARKLNQYEAVDGEEGRYRIPIDRAMDLVVNERYEQGDRNYASDAPFASSTQQ